MGTQPGKTSTINGLFLTYPHLFTGGASFLCDILQQQHATTYIQKILSNFKENWLVLKHTFSLMDSFPFLQLYIVSDGWAGDASSPVCDTAAETAGHTRVLATQRHTIICQKICGNYVCKAAVPQCYQRPGNRDQLVNLYWAMSLIKMHYDIWELCPRTAEDVEASEV